MRIKDKKLSCQCQKKIIFLLLRKNLDHGNTRNQIGQIPAGGSEF